MFDGHLTPIRVTLDVIGEIEQFILASRPDPMDMVRDVAILSVVSEDAYAAVHNEAVALAIDGKDRKSTRLNSSHSDRSRMPSSA